MARTIARLPETRSRYPWSKWTNGKAWSARHGVDFDMSPQAFRCYVVLVGRRRGIKVSTRVRGEIVWFQFGGK